MNQTAPARPFHCHELKTIDPWFQQVWDGEKTFEIRKNDRDFRTGEMVALREYDLDAETYSGREIHARIGYVFGGGTWAVQGLQPGYCVFAIDSLKYRRPGDAQ